MKKNYFVLFLLLIVNFFIVSCTQDSSLKKDTGITEETSDKLMYITVKSPDKTIYGLNEEFDKQGLEVTAYFENGKSKIVTDYSISGFDTSKVAEQLIVTISYTYGGITKKTEITVRITDSSTFTISEKFKQYEDLDNLLEYDENSKTFIALDNYEEYYWWLDGVKQNQSNGFLKITNSMVTDEKTHLIMVVVKDYDGYYYSATKTFALK